MPLCLVCGWEIDDEVMTPCPQCGGAQEHGDADCWFCFGMGQQAVDYCGCPGRRREDGWLSCAQAPARQTNIPGAGPL